jgi:hypothetical protein
MKVDNRLRTAKLKIMYLVTGIVIFAISIYTYFEHYQIGVHPITFKYVLPGIIGVLVFTYVFLLLRKLDYFFIEYLGNKIVVRYYTAYPIFRKYKAFEIPQSYFYDYKITLHFFGLRKSLQIVVNTPKGKFSYPQISISLLSKKQMNDLIKMLNELKKN